MTDRPIIFSGPMVRALLAGRKTQTRRLVKVPGIMGGRYPILPPEDAIELKEGEFARGTFHYRSTGALSGPYRLPAQVDDRLYVRESCAIDQRRVWFRAGHEEAEASGPRVDVRWRPSIHMPRWASRLTLIVEAVRVEPLQAITWDDARAEGLDALSKDGKLVKYGLADRDGLPGNDDDGWHWQDWQVDPTAAFARLWSTLHTKPGERWEDNPAVVAFTFRVLRGNIDEAADGVR